ncbi:MAG: EAL domain-containing protein (putative c-di-GMP-specific phosphodiesterase class I) [Alteromonadaceae bacterium]|jgi:EAL domain-containing protein (putative c-di-GMP-specific phosphodiesterase class I)/GGDEF domain-containing protein
MKSIVKPYLLRASLLAGLAILMGLTLSVFVYISTEKVRHNAIDLVNNRIPILTSVNQIIADLSEQERIIYEYYRSQNSGSFLDEFAKNKARFIVHNMAILSQKSLVAQANLIIEKQKRIEWLSNEFHQAMLLNDDNWDHLRDLLTEIASVRTDLLPTLLAVEKKTQVEVDQAHSATLRQMEITHWTVVVYGLAIVLLGGLVSWYIKQFILTNAKNTRLALFPNRNPNPILSINNLSEISFFNPACLVLLRAVGLDENNIDKLLPTNFIALRTEISSNNGTSMTIEQPLKDRILSVSINWLPEVDSYDLHIVDITERKLAEQKVKHIAFYVQETNLPNQYKLNNDLDELIIKKMPFSLGIFEVKSFNKLVTALGGDTANEIICVFSQLVAKNLPDGVSFYQLNESQFSLVCLRSLSSRSMEELTEIIVMLSQQPVVTHCGEFFVEINVGYGIFPDHGDTRNSLLKNVHTALVRATNDEHHSFSLFSPEFAEEIHKTITLTDSLRHAITLNELFLVYQPQLDLSNNRVLGIETLVRWRHQEHIISPAEFIPLAEQSGLIVPIGEWILNQACLFAKKLVVLGHSELVIAVNVSPRQFSHPKFCQSVINALATSKLSAHNLELEITEGVFMHNEEHTLAVLHQLKSLGIQMSIDDFGTGYSSLSYLKRFPVDKLKIDQSFIMDCHNNNQDKAIVNTIVALGKNLGLSLIAEGVEEQSHVDFLKSIGCDEIQGYWYSRPLVEGDLVNFIAEQLD